MSLDHLLTGSFHKAAKPSGGVQRRITTPVPRHSRKGSPQFSMRLTAEERAQLERNAGETPLATYIKFRLFNNLPPLAQVQGVRGGSDIVLIAQLLAVLGQSRLANNLNQLAHHANIGTLEVTSETEQELLDACTAIKAMRQDLITALGLKGPRS